MLLREFVAESITQIVAACPGLESGTITFDIGVYVDNYKGNNIILVCPSNAGHRIQFTVEIGGVNKESV